MKVDIHEYAEGAIILTGFESAIVGIVEEFGTGRRILYSKHKILDILQTKDSMTYSEAEEYFDYNIIGGYFGDQNPVFLDLELVPKENNGDWEYELPN